MKKLAFGDVDFYDLDISCPMLEELELLNGLNMKGKVKVANLKYLRTTNLDFSKVSLVQEILPLLQHVNELKFRGWFIRAKEKTYDFLFSYYLNFK